MAEIFLYRITAVVDQRQCRVDCSSYPDSLDAVSDVDPGVALPQPRLGVPGHDSVLVDWLYGVSVELDTVQEVLQNPALIGQL